MNSALSETLDETKLLRIYFGAYLGTGRRFFIVAHWPTVDKPPAHERREQRGRNSDIAPRALSCTRSD